MCLLEAHGRWFAWYSSERKPPMTVPDFQSVMMPLRQCAGDGEGHRFSTAVDVLAEHFDRLNEDHAALLPGERETAFYDRVAWATTYL